MRGAVPFVCRLVWGTPFSSSVRAGGKATQRGGRGRGRGGTPARAAEDRQEFSTGVAARPNHAKLGACSCCACSCVPAARAPSLRCFLAGGFRGALACVRFLLCPRALLSAQPDRTHVRVRERRSHTSPAHTRFPFEEPGCGAFCAKVAVCTQRPRHWEALATGERDSAKMKNSAAPPRAHTQRGKQTQHIHYTNTLRHARGFLPQARPTSFP